MFKRTIGGMTLPALAILGLVLAHTTTAQAQSTPSGDLFIDVIVTLDPAFAPGGHAANKAQAADIASDLGISASSTYGTAVFGFAGPVPLGRLNGLENDPRVVDIDLDGVVTATMGPPGGGGGGPPDGGGGPGGGGGGPGGGGGGGGGGSGGETIPWGVDRIGVDPELPPSTGAGVHVYILDTGIDSDHEDLIERLADGDTEHFAVEAVAADCGEGCPEWEDNNGHGTNVAGIVAATDNSVGVIGVAPDAILHAVKVLGIGGSGLDSGVIAAIDWIADGQIAAGGNAVPVVANMSFETANKYKGGSCTTEFDNLDGFGYYDKIARPLADNFYDDMYHAAICAATNLGVVFVAAAGNRGADAASSIPAAYDDAVITVSATYESKKGDGWSFLSNWGNGGGLACCPNGSAPVALAAPGEDILTTATGIEGYDTKSGTSFAAPHVAGVVALYLDQVEETADFFAFVNARDTLVNTAEDLVNNLSDRLAGQRNPHDEDMVNVINFNP